MLKLSDEVIARRVFNRSVNQHLQSTTIMGLLNVFAKEDGVVIDVGAATGHFTYYFASHGYKVLALEAVPVVYDQLVKMKALFPNKISTLNAAISDFNGTGVIYVDDKRLSNSGFRNLVDGPSIEIQTITIDDVAEGLDVGFIKVDVEGTELDVLNGAISTIDKYHPNLLVEIYEPYSRYPLGYIFKWLLDKGYHAYYFANGALVGITSVEDGVNAVKNHHELHDGDFLFTYGEIT